MARTKRGRRSSGASALAGALLMLASPVHAFSWGVVGASLEAEASDSLSFGESWVELLAKHRGQDFGTFESDPNVRGEPRLGGYERNWAHAGAFSGPYIFPSQGTVTTPPQPFDGREQMQGLAAQISAAGGIDLAVLGKFNEDILFRTGVGVFDTTDPGFIAYKDHYVANVLGAVDLLIASGARHVLVAEVSRPPWELFPVAGKQEALDIINAALAAGVAQRGGATFDLWSAIRGHEGDGANLVVGGVVIPLVSTAIPDDLVLLPPGVDPDGFVPGPCYSAAPAGTLCATAAMQRHTLIDGEHPTTLIQALLANAVLSAANREFGLDVPIFRDDEILRIVPEPGSGPLLLVGLAVLSGRARGLGSLARRRRS